jgi:hypothetical protein
LSYYVRQMYSRYSAYMTKAIASERLVRVVLPYLW